MCAVEYYRVEVLPGPLGAVHLSVQLVSHDALSVSVVEMSQIHCEWNGRVWLKEDQK